MEPKDVLERLQTHGWHKNTYGGAEGPNCLLGAIKAVKAQAEGVEYSAVHGTWSNPLTNIIQEVVVEQYSDDIAGFNDLPDTTFDDVERVLEKAQILWEERI